MKRSELISRLTEYLEGETKNPEAKCLAVTVLDICEDTGMLPPLAFHRFQSGEHAWEPEKDENMDQFLERMDQSSDENIKVLVAHVRWWRSYSDRVLKLLNEKKPPTE